MKIFIDAGHNFSGADTGAMGNGLREQDAAFRIADKLKELLKNSGHEVKMSRNKLTDNLGSTLNESLRLRSSMSNSFGADLFISIHCNAYDGRAKGTEVLVYSLKTKAAEVAEKVLSRVVRRLGTFDRGVKAHPGLAVLSGTDCPAILVETAFIDNVSDSELLINRADDFAKAIYEGVTGNEIKEAETVEQTVMELEGSIFVQEIDPKDFKIVTVDREKEEIPLENFFNCGYFASEAGGKTIPVGNLASGGEIISNAKDNPSWVNLAGHKLTTIYTTNDGACDAIKTDDLSSIHDLNAAVSGIPVIIGGKQVSMDEIKAEGYFGNELYDTWHGFLGIRNGRLVYVGAKCAYSQMCWILVALGLHNAIKLDGGGSFILKNGKVLESTNENRKINNIGIWGN